MHRASGRDAGPIESILKNPFIGFFYSNKVSQGDDVKKVVQSVPAQGLERSLA